MEILTRQDIEKIIEERFNVNYHAGVPRIPPHTHNGIDNLQIPSSNIIGLSTGGISGSQTFTSSGTFTIPSGFTKFLVQGVGGGGGSGDSLNQISGGGGGYCEKLTDLTGVSTVTATIGAGGTAGTTAPVAAGNGGDTTFGSYFTAGGGKADGSGGTATGGDVNIPGEPAGRSLTLARPGTSANTDGLSGKGGDSMFGFGGVGAWTASGSNPFAAGIQGVGYGAGASSASSATGAGANANGAAGTAGLIIITW